MLKGGGYRALSDLYVTCQLVADNKPLTIPFRTSFKAFTKDYTYVVPVNRMASEITLTCSIQMERMDHIPNTILRPSAEFADHIHRVGYSWSPCRCSSWWFHISLIRQEMVCVRITKLYFVCLLLMSSCQEFTSRKAPAISVARP